MKDLILVDEIINGTASQVMKAQSTLYRKYEGMLRGNLNKKFSLDEFEVDSIIATTFEKAFRKIETYNSEFSFSTWLIRIAKNSTIDSFRAKKRVSTVSFTDFHSGSEDSDAKDYDPVDPDSTGGFDLQMEDDYDLQLIETLLGNLPNERDREIMRMKYLEDLTHREVGERLDIPQGTIQSIVNKSIKILQSVAGEYVDQREDNINEDLINDYE